jgi:hypothetical protein
VGETIHISWEETFAIRYYELQVFNGAEWVVVSDTIPNTTFAYDYLVPTGFPDTPDLKFRVRAWDADDRHSANWATGHAIVCDSTEPVVTLTPDPTTWTNGDVTVGIAATENLSGIVSIEIVTSSGTTSLTPANTLSYTGSSIFSTNGTIVVTVTDACGNANTTTIGASETDNMTYTVTNIDKIAPTVSALADPVSGTGSKPDLVTVTLSFDDPDSSALYGVSTVASQEY